MRRGPAAALAAFLAAAVAGAAGPGGAADDPHAFLAAVGECLRCHVDVPRKGGAPGAARLQKDVVSLCLDCHREKDLSTLHPVDIRPGAPVPEDLPLDDHGTITCATCHDPHGPYEADEPHVAQALSRRVLSLLTGRKKHRTFYLRRPNDKGQLCLGCHDRAQLATEAFHVREASLLDQYAGSQACKGCHPEVYREWVKTPHARMTRDAKADPGAVAGDFGPGAPFPRDEVRYVLGSHWTQRYVVEKGGRLMVKAPIWSLVLQQWDTTYWIDKPWTQYCQGCHTTGFEMRGEPRFAELGVGCEACHGPGKAHAQGGAPASIVNPARLDPERRLMVCQSCHTTGHDRTGQYRYPLGYLPGKDLTRYFRGLLPKPGQDNTTFAGDESYEDRHRQWLFWVDSFLDARGVTCDVCKNFRSQLSPTAKPKMSVSEYCLTCHRKDWPQNELHTGHLERAVHCQNCHVPGVNRSGTGHSIHDHKFLFGEPQAPAGLSPREACTRCHRSVAATGG